MIQQISYMSFSFRGLSKIINVSHTLLISVKKNREQPVFLKAILEMSWKRKCFIISERVKFSKRSNPPDEDARNNDFLKEIIETFTFSQVPCPKIKILSLSLDEVNFANLMNLLNRD